MEAEATATDAEKRFLYDAFAKSRTPNASYDNAEVRTFEKGVLRLKRETLGLCGTETTKSSGELVDLLLDLRVANDLDHACQIIPMLCKNDVLYSMSPSSKGNYLCISKPPGENTYRIAKVTRDIKVMILPKEL